MKLVPIILITAIFVALLLLVNYVHMRFFPVNVVFYAAIADAFIASGVTGLLLLFSGFFKSLGAVEKAQLVVIFLLLGYAFAISIPTVIDRSLSFYILEKIQQRGGGIRQDRIGDVFINEYLPEFRLVDVRLTEQLESGTVEIKDGCVKLTQKGQLMASIGQYYRRNVLPTQRLLMGEYTNALTDPFKNSRRDVDYAC